MVLLPIIIYPEATGKGAHMNVATEEQETVIQLSRNDSTASIWTSDTTAMTKLDHLCKRSAEWKLQEVNHFKDGSVSDKKYSCPKAFISYRSKAVTMNLTEEQRQQRAEQIKAARMA